VAGHDQLWKQVLQAFFPDFVRLFDATTAAGLDLSSVEFRDSEAFTDIPHGERRIADLVAQVRTVAGDPELVLVHVEIQRVRQADFSQRMWQYYALLRQREGLPVIPIALVLYPAREGVGVEEYVEAVLGRTYLTFRFLQVSLPVLPAQEYVTGRDAAGRGPGQCDAPADRGQSGARGAAPGMPAPDSRRTGSRCPGRGAHLLVGEHDCDVPAAERGGTDRAATDPGGTRRSHNGSDRIDLGGSGPLTRSAGGPA
jgi:hypothetical protein